MKPYRATETAEIDAPAQLVYEIIADYHHGHPLILPKPYFVSLRVEQGGFGAGTIISFEMKVAGQTQTFRAAITEPDPGRVLVETNLAEGGAVTTFEIVPLTSGSRSRVIINTSGVTKRGGVLGSLERVMTTSYLRRIYRKELHLLAALIKERAKISRQPAAKNPEEESQCATW